MSRRRQTQKIKKAVALALEAEKARQAQAGQGQGPAAQPGEAATPSGVIGEPYHGDRLGNRLERRALRGGWPIKEDAKIPLVNRQIKIAADPNTPNREATQAYLAVLATDKFNHELEKAAAGGDNLNVHLSGGIGVVQRDEASINARIRDYLSEYAALEARAVVIEVEPKPRMVGQNGRNGHAE